MGLISNIHIEKIKENAISNSIRNGFSPSSKNINSIISDYIYHYDIGNCNANYLSIPRFSKSSSKKWNDTMKFLDNDINVLYEANNRLRSDINKIGNELIYLQNKVSNENKKTNQRIENLKNILSNDINYTYKTYIFDDFENVEFYSKDSRNIPATTSFVDLVSKSVSNPKADFKYSDVNLSKCSVDIRHDSNNNFLITGELINTINKSNIPTIISSEDSISCDMSFDIEISSLIPFYCNNIKIELNSIGYIDCNLKVKDVDDITHTIGSTTTMNFAEWSFDNKEINTIIISFDKRDSSGISDIKTYTNLIAINSINVSNDLYKNKSVFVSKSIKYNTILDTIKVNVIDEVFNGTNIEYFVGVDNNKDSINWINIKKDKETFLNLLEKKDEILCNEIPYFGHKMKNNCYMIGNLRKHFNSNSVKILSGYQQWNVEVLSNSKFNGNYILDMNDYNKSEVIERTSIDYESYKIRIKPNKMFAMNTIIYSDKDYETLEYYIKPKVSKGSTFQCIVIFNNNIIKNTNGTYKFAFRKGRNVVSTLMYSNEECVFTHNMNFKTVSENCCHGGKMKQVSENYLYNNVNTDNDTYYCIDSNGNIIVKLNPMQLSEYFKSEIDKDDINFQDHTRFLLSYKYLAERNYSLCLRNNMPDVGIRFMAMLSSESKYISPKLINYTVEGR